MDNSLAFAGLWLAFQLLGLPALVFTIAFLGLRRALGAGPAQGAAALAGVIAGWAALFGPQAAFPPVQTLDWLPWLLAGLAGILYVSARLRADSPEPGLAFWVTVLAGGLYLLSPPLLREQPAAVLAAEWGAALTLAALLVWALGRAAGRAHASAALAAAFASLGFVTALGGSLVVGGLAIAAFAVAALVWLGQLSAPRAAASRRPAPRGGSRKLGAARRFLESGRLPAAGRAGLAAGAVLWAWLAFSARHLAEVPLPETLLSAAAAAAALLGFAPAAQGLLRRLAHALPAAAPAALAVGLAVWRSFSAVATGY